MVPVAPTCSDTASIISQTSHACCCSTFIAVSCTFRIQKSYQLAVVNMGMRCVQGGTGRSAAEDAGGTHLLCGAVLAVGGAGGERGVCATHDQHLRPLLAPATHRPALCQERDAEKPPWPGVQSSHCQYMPRISEDVDCCTPK